MSSMPAESRGFTLIELMITIFIGALLLAIAVPSFQSTIASNRLATQTNDLVGALNYARSEAITRNTRVRLCRAANETSTTCAGSVAIWAAWIVRNDTTGEIARRGVVNRFNNSMVVRSTLPADTIIFGPDGLARINATTLVSTQQLRVCTTATSVGENHRNFQLGATSRLSIARATGACT
jgi:type IV fimbrial biogenesis protein FimT